MIYKTYYSRMCNRIAKCYFADVMQAQRSMRCNLYRFTCPSTNFQLRIQLFSECHSLCHRAYINFKLLFWCSDALVSSCCRIEGFCCSEDALQNCCFSYGQVAATVVNSLRRSYQGSLNFFNKHKQSQLNRFCSYIIFGT